MTSVLPPTQASLPEPLNFDPVAPEYDQSRFLPPEAQEVFARLLQKEAALAPGEALLDAGVGTGRFALPLARLGTPVVGVDVSENMMAQLLEKRALLEPSGETVPVRVVRGDLRRLPLGTGQFGAALMVHILHLIVEWEAAALEIRRVLKPGRPLLLAVEEGRFLPSRDHYFRQARERGVLRGHRGATNLAMVNAFLSSQNATITQVDTSALRWTLRVPVLQTLDYLRRRVYSNLWAVPEADHTRLIAETEEWARTTYGTLETVEEAEVSLLLWKAQFSP